MYVNLNSFVGGFNKRVKHFYLLFEIYIDKHIHLKIIHYTFNNSIQHIKIFSDQLNLRPAPRTLLFTGCSDGQNLFNCFAENGSLVLRSGKKS